MRITFCILQGIYCNAPDAPDVPPQIPCENVCIWYEILDGTDGSQNMHQDCVLDLDDLNQDLAELAELDYNEKKCKIIKTSPNVQSEVCLCNYDGCNVDNLVNGKPWYCSVYTHSTQWTCGYFG